MLLVGRLCVPPSYSHLCPVKPSLRPFHVKSVVLQSRLPSVTCLAYLLLPLRLSPLSLLVHGLGGSVHDLELLVTAGLGSSAYIL